MTSNELRDLYATLNDSITLPEEEVNAIAEQLLDAPENNLTSRSKRLQAILLHSNLSETLYNRAYADFTPEELTSDESNIIHLLISHKHATSQHVTILKKYAEQCGRTSWFNTTVKTTHDLSAYQLNLSYNGEYMYQDSDIRSGLSHTSQILEEFLK